MQKSIEQKIQERITRLPRGQIVTPADFADYGSSEAVRQALSRLAANEHIVRAAQGIYVRPEISKNIGLIKPTAEEIAEAIAKRDKARTIPAGNYALNALGLSSQVPVNLVLLTDGSPRQLKVGKRTITFKKTAPKNLAAKGKISRLVIQALKAIGKDTLTEPQEEKIVALLRKENKADLQHDIPLAPVWIQEIMRKALSDG